MTRSAPRRVRRLRAMPVLRTETIHGWPCKFYDNGTVNVGTRAADRFSIKVPPDERHGSLQGFAPSSSSGSWRRRRSCQRTRLAKRPWQRRQQPRRVGHRGRRKSGSTKLWQPRQAAAAARDTARHHEAVAGHKRQLAELDHKIAVKTVKLAKAVPLVRGLCRSCPSWHRKLRRSRPSSS